MNDLISRQAAIKAIEDLHDCDNGFSDTYDKACIIGVIEEVPSAQRTGRWVIEMELPHVGTHCSECGWAWSDNLDAIKLTPVLSLIKTNYCPNCGCKMGETE